MGAERMESELEAAIAAAEGELATVKCRNGNRLTVPINKLRPMQLLMHASEF